MWDTKAGSGNQCSLQQPLPVTGRRRGTTPSTLTLIWEISEMDDLLSSQEMQPPVPIVVIGVITTPFLSVSPSHLISALPSRAPWEHLPDKLLALEFCLSLRKPQLSLCLLQGFSMQQLLVTGTVLSIVRY